MSLCKCGKKIVWGTTALGKRIPLDPAAPVYSIVRVADDRTEVCRTTLAMVSHFTTCANANDFSESTRTK